MLQAIWSGFTVFTKTLNFSFNLFHTNNPYNEKNSNENLTGMKSSLKLRQSIRNYERILYLIFQE